MAPAQTKRVGEVLGRDIHLRDIGTILVAIAALIGALGFVITSPGKRFDDYNTRLTRVELRADSAAEQQRFANYMLCVLIRRSDPAAVPPGCAPITDPRLSR